MTDFDFIENEGTPKVDTEIATSGNPKVDTRIQPEVITKARKFAESPKGLEIESFFIKHNLTCDINQLLHGKLDKDGYLL